MNIRIYSSGEFGFRLRGVDLFTTFRFQKQAGIQGSILTYITIADAMVNNGGQWKTITALGPKDPLVALRYTVSITVVRMENRTVHRQQTKIVQGAYLLHYNTY